MLHPCDYDYAYKYMILATVFLYELFELCNNWYIRKNQNNSCKIGDEKYLLYTRVYCGNLVKID